MDLLKLYTRCQYGNGLQQAAAISIWENEITSRFEKFKAELKKLGYEKITIGEHSDWGHSKASGNMVFAEPKLRVGHWPGLWNRNITDIMGGHGCGNGMKTSDQVQLNLPSDAVARFRGGHIL